MKKLSEKYLHPDTKITFEVKFQENVDVDFSKLISMIRNDGDREFIFSNSRPETLIKIGKALQEIGTFVEQL